MGNLVFRESIRESIRERFSLPVPQDVKTWRELKQWVSQNPTAGPDLDTIKDWEWQEYDRIQWALEQQNKKRLMMARQEQDGMPRDSPGGPVPGPNVQLSQSPSPQELWALEQQNKKRLMMARQEQDDIAWDKIRALEKQNKKRLMMARQQQDDMPWDSPGGLVLGPNVQLPQGASPQGQRTRTSPNLDNKIERRASQLNAAVTPSPLPEGQGRGSFSAMNQQAFMQNNQTMLAAFNAGDMNGVGTPPANGLNIPSAGPAGSPRMGHPGQPQQPNGSVSQITKLESQFRFQFPTASPDQISKLVRDALSQDLAAQRQSAMHAAAGSGTALAGMPDGIQNSPQQYVQMLRAQQERQAAAASQQPSPRPAGFKVPLDPQMINMAQAQLLQQGGIGAAPGGQPGPNGAPMIQQTSQGQVLQAMLNPQQRGMTPSAPTAFAPANGRTKPSLPRQDAALATLSQAVGNGFAKGTESPTIPMTRAQEFNKSVGHIPQAQPQREQRQIQRKKATIQQYVQQQQQDPDQEHAPSSSTKNSLPFQEPSEEEKQKRKQLIDDYYMQMMLLEQQNKKRLLMRLQQQRAEMTQGMNMETQRPPGI